MVFSLSHHHDGQRHPGTKPSAFNKIVMASVFGLVVFSFVNMFRFEQTRGQYMLEIQSTISTLLDAPSEYEHGNKTVPLSDVDRPTAPDPVPSATPTTTTKSTTTSTTDATEVNVFNVGDDVIEDSFSACILWMDDNFRLEEWLAYHYYHLKLRYVVLNIDPFSKTSPNAIIDRWNDRENKYNLNMTIVTMKDSDYIENYDSYMESNMEARSNSSQSKASKASVNIKTDYHRKRQHEFYKACSKHLIQQNQSWTSFHDTDEFLAFVPDKEDGPPKMEQPGYVLHKLNSIKNQLPLTVNETGLSCLIVDRRRVCAKELSTEDTNDLFSTTPSDGSTTGGIVPEGFMNSSIDSSKDEDRKTIVGRFDTLRYKYLTRGGDGMPKSFIDLSQMNPKLYVQEKYWTNHRWRTHKVMTHLCNKEAKQRLSEINNMVKKEKFLIYHYLGSFESYSFRDDARKGGSRNAEKWRKRANDTKGEFSHVMRPWLRGFVELVGGPKVASYLLQDAGKFPDDYDVVSRINEYNT